MKHLRAVLRLFILTTYTAVSFFIYLIVYLLLSLFRIPIAAARNVYMKCWAEAASIVLNFRVEVRGNAPAPPFFLVTNHLSYIDILPIYKTVKGTFVAKKEIRSWPALGFMVKTMGVIFVDRSRKKDVTRVNRIISNALHKHQGMILFPEGTTSPGEKLLRFKPSLLEFPAEKQMPVHYATISYHTRKGDLPARRSVCWFGGRDFFGHLYKLASNRGVYCIIEFGDNPVQKGDRKELSDELYKKMKKQFIPSSEPREDKPLPEPSPEVVVSG